MTELKPCPFCGGYVHLDEAYSYFRDFVLYCEGCNERRIDRSMESTRPVRE